MHVRAQDAWAAFSAAAEPFRHAWLTALDAPGDAQATVLSRLLAANRNTAFGMANEFADISDPAQFRERVPATSYAGMSRWIDRALQESAPILTDQAPRFFERTSGGSEQQKLIPYTPAFLEELQFALIVWLADLHRTVPGVAAGRAYWSMSPPMQARERAPNGIMIGSDSDLDYLAGSPLVDLLPTLVAPSLSGNGRAWRNETLRALIASDDLAFISVWSPTFLTSLLRPLFDHAEPQRRDTLTFLFDSLPSIRMAALRRALDDGHCGRLWPQLAAVSCWMDGPSKGYATHARTLFPQAAWLPKGLFSTEAVVSLPFGDTTGCPLAVCSHFLEFLLDDGTAIGVEELKPGDTVEVVVTTGGGLYRYRLGDRVRVTGYAGRTPCVAFVGRAGTQSDLVGEKLDEAYLAASLSDVLQPGDEGCVIPCADADPPHYLLLLASGTQDVAALRDALEQALARAFHYRHARTVGQLGPLRAVRVPGGAAQLADLVQRAHERAGIRAGDVKPRALVAKPAVANALRAFIEDTCSC
ncbi:auxin-responsive GH3-related protein [Burkholderia cepacia]|uniref:GH3 family domain-containing protein n=1 Tax=Burkholderia cepacia TaxID=292 RepID=UPI00075AAE65|nr:GH3 auxin-responsive promoter family protein [Burkholderia cepacia]KVL22151.1 auxin-responsive GH3-related protein [Burkholderia cepacia]KVQ23195.1 auxin-responsive GH3-related protein [Burkholderia cepacia]KVV58926.1 auxin-responsive GH3-related protein [Burkholderia cepacia]KVV66920.1 auxin-responsive GH3-related protein [Burkholderia cepacia]KVV73890.1 auxin-responsive GH3-related protein [Burkholderia cepacia]